MTTATHTLEFVDRFTAALGKVVTGPAVLHEPVFGGNEWKYVKDCIDTGWVSSAGLYVDKFESHLQTLTGVDHAVAIVNGTAALYLALKLLSVKPNDEVLVPTLSFVSPANAIAQCNAIPHFVDAEHETLGVDAEKLEKWLQSTTQIRNNECVNKKTGRRIHTLIGVHVFGHPFNLDEVLRVCQKFHIEVIEDAAEALGSLYKDKHVGHWGKISVLSFNGNKTVTTGGGGALLISDAELAKHARHLTTTAKIPHPWRYDHDAIGYNFRLPNLNAALGCAQLEQLPGFLKSKRALTNRYKTAFSNLSGVRLVVEPSFSRSNYWLNAILLEQDVAQLRDAILERTNQQGFMTRPSWSLIHKFDMYRACPRMDLSCAEELEQQLINLPSSASL
jgi:perosamine synthetase